MASEVRPASSQPAVQPLVIKQRMLLPSTLQKSLSAPTMTLLPLPLVPMATVKSEPEDLTIKAKGRSQGPNSGQGKTQRKRQMAADHPAHSCSTKTVKSEDTAAEGTKGKGTCPGTGEGGQPTAVSMPPNFIYFRPLQPNTTCVR